MNGYIVALVVIDGIALLALPRPWVALALLIGTLYIPLGIDAELGPFNFPIIRILILVGILRVLLRVEFRSFTVNGLDQLVAVWAVWAILSSFLHEAAVQTLVNHLGLVFNACGAYYLLRIFCQSLDDVIRLTLALCGLLLPLSLSLLWESQTGYNVYAFLGGVDALSEIRHGSIRAQGPFSHSILAGTIGAINLPLMIALWSTHRKTAIVGILACLTIIAASGSSGPLMGGLVAMGALFMWHFRRHVRALRWAVVLGYIALELATNAPAYYILARIDLAGGSTGWHRAALIETALYHLPEWWLAGTDYTRHWLPYGVPWSADHVDITNYYITMGVTGGLPLMLLFIAILLKGFSYVGAALGKAAQENASRSNEIFIWALGSSLLVHAVTFISISYFDQSVVFLYFTLAAICASRFPAVITPPVVTLKGDARWRPLATGCSRE